LFFMYTGEIKNNSSAMDLFAISSKYDVQQLKTIAKDIILENLERNSAIEVFSLGHLHNCVEMKQTGFNEIKKMFLPEVELNDELMSMPEELKKIAEIRMELDRKMKEIQADYEKKLSKFNIEAYQMKK
jgi:hypothetical protein